MQIKSLANPSDTFDLRLPEKKPFDVVGFGTNSVDYLCVVSQYPECGRKTGILNYEKLPGGQVATAITFLAHMGLKTKYIGKAGGDELGSFLLGSFEHESVDTSSLLVEPEAQNQFAVIVIDGKSGERTVMSRRDSKLDFRRLELHQNDICGGRILHLDGYDSEGSLMAARWCHEQGIPVSIDLDTVVPNCAELIRYVDFLIVSSDFPAQFTGIADPAQAFTALHRTFNGFLAVTLGSQGANAWVGNRCINFPANKIKAVDTTGAGDIFHAAFLYGILQNWPLVKIMSFSNTAAALSCGRLGARAGIHSLDEILGQMDHASL